MNKYYMESKKCVSAQAIELKNPVFVFNGDILERYDNMLVTVFEDGTKQAHFIEQKYPKFVEVEKSTGVVPRDGGQFTQRDFDRDVFTRYMIYAKFIEHMSVDDFYRIAYQAGLGVHKMKSDMKEQSYRGMESFEEKEV